MLGQSNSNSGTNYCIKHKHDSVIEKVRLIQWETYFMWRPGSSCIVLLIWWRVGLMGHFIYCIHIFINWIPRRIGSIWSLIDVLMAMVAQVVSLCTWVRTKFLSLCWRKRSQAIRWCQALTSMKRTCPPTIAPRHIFL